MQIAQYAESFGAFVALLLSMTIGGLLARGIDKSVTAAASNGQTVEGVDLLFYLGAILKDWALFLFERKVASVCTSGAFTVLLFVPALSTYAALGYATLVFAVVGFASPATIRQIEGMPAQEKSPGQVD